jgi:hypothetical protein
MPAFLGIENDWFFVSLLQDHIAWAVPVTGPAVFTLFIIDYRWHMLLSDVIF